MSETGSTKEEVSSLVVEAMKLDILNLLRSATLGVFEIRQIQHVCKAVVDFLNSLDTFSEREAWGIVLRETEGKAPALHAALRNRTFDGESAFKELYVALLEEWSMLRDTRLDTQELAKRLADGERRQALASQLKLPPLPPTLAEVRARELSAGHNLNTMLTEGNGDDDGDETDPE